jgi:hypothetical protein
VSVNPAELDRIDGGENDDETDDDAEGQHGDAPVRGTA